MIKLRTKDGAAEFFRDHSEVLFYVEDKLGQEFADYFDSKIADLENHVSYLQEKLAEECDWSDDYDG